VVFFLKISSLNFLFRHASTCLSNVIYRMPEKSGIIGKILYLQIFFNLLTPYFETRRDISRQPQEAYSSGYKFGDVGAGCKIFQNFSDTCTLINNRANS
jgi:hypothetical protein